MGIRIVFKICYIAFIFVTIGSVLSGLVGVSGGIVNAAQTELITNGGFESGLNGWNVSGDFHADSGFPYPHSGTRYAYLSTASGNPGNNLTGIMYQAVSIPSSATSATLTFWYNITTDEIGSSGNDVLNVTIQNSAGAYLSTVAVWSNLNKQSIGAYSQKTFDLTSYIGQTIRIHFLGTTNGSLPTVFRIDDVSILATSPDNQAPIALASGMDLSGLPADKVLIAGQTYSVTAKYFDPDGRTNLKYCYLAINNPYERINLMWDQNGYYAPNVSEAPEYAAQECWHSSDLG